MNKIIHEKALGRIARIFKQPVSSLNLNLQFGEDLKCSFVSDFKDNEFDIINNDIRDVADKVITKELNSGNLTIRSVGDYCKHMEICFEKNPKEVERVLQQNNMPG